MRGIQLVAAAGAAVNLGFAFGAWVANRDSSVSLVSIIATIFLLALSVAPFVLAAVQADRHADEPRTQRLIAAALVAAIIVAGFAYSAALRQADQDGLIFAVVPIFQLLVVLFALAASGYLHRKRIP